MESLALLCNLHADGPKTLQRLRRSGCESLATLLRLDSSDLSARLDWNERQAQRFLREAALLVERLEDGTGEEYEPEEEGNASESVRDELQPEQAELEEAEDESEEEELVEEEEEDSEVEEGFAPPQQRLEAVLGTWRELDRVSPPTDPEFTIPRPAFEALPDRPLTHVAIEGLTPRLVARLRELGIVTLRDLVSAHELELVRAVPLGFTRLKHLLFLAARELEALPRPEGATVGAEPELGAYVAYSPPPSEPFETAGPFA